jgi:hypothetical protein
MENPGRLFRDTFTLLFVVIGALGITLGYSVRIALADCGTQKCGTQQKICQGANAVLCEESDNGLPDGCRFSSCESLCNNTPVNEKICTDGGNKECCILQVTSCPQTHEVCYCNFFCLCVTLFGCFTEECSPDAYNFNCTATCDCDF